MRPLIFKTVVGSCLLSMFIACASVSRRHVSNGHTGPSIPFGRHGRTPAAELIDPVLEKRFQSLLSRDVTYGKNEMAINLRFLSSGYYRAEVLKTSFDKELDNLVKIAEKNANKTQPAALTQISVYPQMLALWHIYRGIEEKLTYYHVRLLQTAYEEAEVAAGAPEQYKKKGPSVAQKLLREFYDTVVGYEGMDGVTVSDLAQEIVEQNQAYHDALDQNDLPDNLQVRLGDLETVFKEKGNGTWDPEQFRKKAEAQSKIKDQVSEDVRKQTPLYQEIIKILPLDPKRLPQQVVAQDIRPGGIGTKGNLIGSEFPKGTWTLTYDDGPHGVHTPNVLANLKKNGVPATFFQLAQSVKTYPAVTRAVIEAKNHVLANHSYSHPQVPKQSDAGMKKEIAQSTADEATAWTKMLEEIRAKDPTETRKTLRAKFFRLPYGDGVKNVKARNMIAEEDMVHVFWNIDTLDWQDKNPQSILDRTIKQMKIQRRGIILFHDTHSQSVEASRMLMEWYNANKVQEGLRMVTLPQIVRELNCPDMIANPTAPNCPANMWQPE